MVGILFGIFAFLLVFGVPISVATGVASIIPGLLDSHFVANGEYIVRAIVSGADSTPILAVPLFMLSGALMTSGGISKRLFDVFALIAGKKTGGIPCAVVLTCLFFGTISGSGPATCAAVTGMCLPVLLKLGYDKEFSCGIIAAAGGLGIIIPPSATFIVYGLATGTSVGDLFIAGIIPGITIAGCLLAYVYLYCRMKGEDKQKIAENYEELKKQGVFHVLKSSALALLTPVIILGSIYTGIATPTEAAVISVFYALFVSLFGYKTMNFRDIPKAVTTAAGSMAPLCLILAIATAFGRVLALLQVPGMLTEFIMDTIPFKAGVLLLFCAVILIMGMFMDCAPAEVILAPMLIPTMIQFGISPVHFGIILTCGIALGFMTPPFGLNLFITAKQAGIPAGNLYKKVIPFVFVFIVAWMLITYIPAISLCLLG